MVVQLTWALGMAMALGLVGGGPSAPPRLAALPSSRYVSGVPLAEPHSNWCGPAALAAVLQFHGERAAAAEIARDIYLPGYRGTLNLDLLLWARKRGLEVWAGRGSAPEVKRALVRNRPVICLVRRHGRLADRNHFVVVRGYDDSRRIWLLDDGSGKEHAASGAGFERDWQECGCWMMVVEGKGRASEGERESDQHPLSAGAGRAAGRVPDR
jgi:ABC-type bacteriocin/lantibiotic exporter with double-glycine peptidase domain